MGKLSKGTGGKGGAITGYDGLVEDLVALLASARSTAARAVNAVMTATYWEIGRRIVEHEQGGAKRAGYGEELLARLAEDLTNRLGRGFSARGLDKMRLFYRTWSNPPTSSAEFPELPISPTLSAKSDSGAILQGNLPCFPLSWSHYVRLMSVRTDAARRFYEAEALRGGWTVRQLDRQIDSQFYERTALSRDKVAMLRKGQRQKPEDAVTPEEEIKNPYVLEFLDLKDEYSESEMEEALIRRLESFLLELGGDFAFIGRQRRLRVGDAWYRVDLLFFHRKLRCLVVIDLKHGKFTHADAGQMHLYLNYAREHWMREGENPPVGLILCTQKDAAVAHYALDGLPNKVIAAEYRTALPEEKVITDEMVRAHRLLAGRVRPRGSKRSKV
jgi:predicted nuclease of restriction endonuclease-like (RecB) superfamily